MGWKILNFHARQFSIVKAHFHWGKCSVERKFCKMWFADANWSWQFSTFNNDIFEKFSVRGREFIRLFPIVPDVLNWHFPCKLSLLSMWGGGGGDENNFPSLLKFLVTFTQFSYFQTLYCICLLFKVISPKVCPTYVYNLPDFILTAGSCPTPPSPVAYA